MFKGDLCRHMWQQISTNVDGGTNDTAKHAETGSEDHHRCDWKFYNILVNNLKVGLRIFLFWSEQLVLFYHPSKTCVKKNVHWCRWVLSAGTRVGTPGSKVPHLHQRNSSLLFQNMKKVVVLMLHRFGLSCICFPNYSSQWLYITWVEDSSHWIKCHNFTLQLCVKKTSVCVSVSLTGQYQYLWNTTMGCQMRTIPAGNELR